MSTDASVRSGNKPAVRGCAVLSRDAVERWPEAMLAAGTRVIAPCVTTDGRATEYVMLAAGAAATGFGKGLPRQSPKAAWFPRSEPVLKLARTAFEWELADPEQAYLPTVIFGARPCDAAAPEVLAPLFGWDYHDPFFEERVKHLGFIVVGCSAPVDAACFCTSVGVDPAGEGVGDVTLMPLADGRFAAEALTAMGEKLLALAGGSPAETNPNGEAEVARAAARAAVPVQFDRNRVRAALEKNFNDPRWEQSARACLACGTCAFVCPTCHCFDIQEEMCGCSGVRQKNWDACAFPVFTAHTSGHNPRPDQAARWRQRLNHKFRYYPEKFDHTLCTGCGRCLRMCPAGMDLLADLTDLAAAADGPPVALAGQVQPAEAIGGNIYKPYRMKIAMLRDETPDVRTLRLEFVDPQEAAKFDFKVGQFGLYSAFGEGESTFCIASSPTRKGSIECTFRQAGRVTKALRRLDVGDVMGFRGPYGNQFPVADWKGQNLLFVAGGIALPPMRCVIQYCLDNRADYKDITIVYGARTWADHVYKDELSEWEKRPDVKLWLCIDWKPAPGKGLSDQAAEEGWTPINMQDPGATVLDPAHRRYTGFVPQLVEAAKPSPENCTAVLCGPPVMIKFTLASLQKLGFQPAHVYTTLENRMKCGLGKCGRCNVGPVYVCKEGPVFTAEQIAKLPPEM